MSAVERQYQALFSEVDGEGLHALLVSSVSRSAPAGAQGVEDNRHIDDLLQQGSLSRLNLASRREDHGRSAHYESRDDALTRESHRTSTDFNCFSNSTQIVVQDDCVGCFGGDSTAVTCHSDTYVGC